MMLHYYLVVLTVTTLPYASLSLSLSLLRSQLLTIFVSAKLAAYVKFYQCNKDFIDSLGE